MRVIFKEGRVYFLILAKPSSSIFSRSVNFPAHRYAAQTRPWSLDSCERGAQGASTAVSPRTETDRASTDPHVHTDVRPQVREQWRPFKGLRTGAWGGIFNPGVKVQGQGVVASMKGSECKVGGSSSMQGSGCSGVHERVRVQGQGVVTSMQGSGCIGVECMGQRAGPGASSSMQGSGYKSGGSGVFTGITVQG